jgi:small subunit ribosomal protein S4
MARRKDASCKQCRRAGEKLFLKGTKCTTGKCPIEKRPYAPGEHGRSRKKLSNYGLQLMEKQKVKRMYGVMEKQFRRYFSEAEKSKGVTGEKLLQMLERRLDNVIYHSLFATSRAEARQLVRHGHILVNGKKVNLPSYQVKEKDVIKVRDKENIIKKTKEAQKRLEEREISNWLEVEANKREVHIKRLPTKEDIQVPIKEQLIVELYSK